MQLNFINTLDKVLTEFLDDVQDQLPSPLDTGLQLTRRFWCASALFVGAIFYEIFPFIVFAAIAVWYFLSRISDPVGDDSSDDTGDGASSGIGSTETGV